MVSIPTSLPDVVTADWLRRFRARLRRWHRVHGRALPWRGADPYRVWVSEIMLQQTTVTAVVPYYERFLAAFPNVASLAAANESDVLRQWEGLGYYRRARNLHRAAQLVVAEHGGRVPDGLDVLLSLPGIGRYTAGAIVSFGYGRRAPIVEANTQRLYARLLDFDGDPRSADGGKLLWAFAAAVLPRTAPGEFNQALIDLGATVCVAGEPKCSTCPVMTLCGGRRRGRQSELPRAARRPALTDVVECAVIVERGGRCLVRRCRPGERWAGLWDFPRFAADTVPAEQPVEDPWRLFAALAEAGVQRLTGVRSQVIGRLGELRHGVTRYRIRLVCLQANRSSSIPAAFREECRWVDAGELSQLPLSKTGRRLARLWEQSRLPADRD